MSHINSYYSDGVIISTSTPYGYMLANDHYYDNVGSWCWHVATDRCCWFQARWPEAFWNTFTTLRMQLCKQRSNTSRPSKGVSKIKQWPLLVSTYTCEPDTVFECSNHKNHASFEVEGSKLSTNTWLRELFTINKKMISVGLALFD